MACCGLGRELAMLMPNADTAGEELLLASRIVADGMRQTDSRESPPATAVLEGAG